MKTFKVLIVFTACMLLSSFYASGQVIDKTIVVTIDHLNYDLYAPGMGTVTGYYTYEINMKMTKEGYLERLNWHVGKSELINDKGDKVIIVDSGKDNLGIMWDWFNNANYYNWYFYNCPEVVYDSQDGWLNDYMPPEMPAEGVFMDMSCKMVCKGAMYQISSMAVIHYNGNGELVVNFVKP